MFLMSEFEIQRPPILYDHGLCLVCRLSLQAYIRVMRGFPKRVDIRNYTPVLFIEHILMSAINPVCLNSLGL